jgi:hypothetical protein
MVTSSTLTESEVVNMILMDKHIFSYGAYNPRGWQAVPVTEVSIYLPGVDSIIRPGDSSIPFFNHTGERLLLLFCPQRKCMALRTANQSVPGY